MKPLIESYFSACQEITAALNKVKSIFDPTRNLKAAGYIAHQYVDKYSLAEFMANCGLVATLNVFTSLDLDAAKISILQSWITDKSSITLHLRSKEECVFLREEKRKVDPKTEVQANGTSSAGGNSIFSMSKSEKAVTVVTEYIYQVSAEYHLYFSHGGTFEKIMLQENTLQTEVTKTTPTLPYPPILVHENNVDMSFLFELLDKNQQFSFSIDKNDSKCKTPRRNTPVLRLLSNFRSLLHFSHNISMYFTNFFCKESLSNSSEIDILDASSIFVPILPIFEEGLVSCQYRRQVSSTEPQKTGFIRKISSENPTSLLLSVEDANLLLEEQRKSIFDKFSDLAIAIPKLDRKLISLQEAKLITIFQHLNSISLQMENGMDYLENMLYEQLTAAFGKEFHPHHFSDFMIHYNQKLFRPEYCMQPFSFLVKRTEHYPEGVVTIESDGAPIYTSCFQLEGTASINMALNASTSIVLRGQRYVHSWVNHTFGGQPEQNFSLVARAKQFSSFVLVVGRLCDRNILEYGIFNNSSPKGAIIIQNKDELILPLILGRISSATEFKSAILSLSPEQKRFAKAMREVQMKGALFGICMIQIKPQIEKLLKLPDDSLTKQIKLTQDLMTLFVKYQIPSDLVTFDGHAAANQTTKIEAVKKYVDLVHQTLNETRKDEVERVKETSEQYSATTPHPWSASNSFAIGDEMVQANALGLHHQQQPASLPKVKTIKKATSTTIPQTPLVIPQSVLPMGSKASKEEYYAGFDLTGQVESTDLTMMAARIEAAIEGSGVENVRTSMISVGESWSRRSSRTRGIEVEVLRQTEQESEKNSAYELLDAMSRSGNLEIECVDMHLMVATTHSFPESLIETVVKWNENAVEVFEKSVLVVSAEVFGVEVFKMVEASQIERLKELGIKNGRGDNK